MSSNWSQDGHPQMGGPPMHQSSAPVRRGTNPPPVCFKCGGEHFLVDCPESHTSNTGFAPPAVPYQQAPAPPSQQYPQGGQSQYPSYTPNQQYDPPAPQYQYNQPSQPYTSPAPAPSPYVALPSNPQYSRPGYQPPPYNQSNGPPQYPAVPYQLSNPQYNAHGPAPYQVPANKYQSQGNGGYRGGYQSAPVSGPYHHPPPQWNATPPGSQLSYPKPRNSGNFQREFSGAPSHSSQQHHYRQPSRSQSLQLDHPIKTPQTLSSQGLQCSPPKPPTGSVPLTPANHPNIRRGSSATVNVANPKPESKLASDRGQIKAKEIPEQETEEGEVCEADEEEELFEWDLKRIFKEPPAAETVALAQPLSAGYESTPVPLVQAWSTSIPSISRYARKDNLREFIKSVRVAPQWSYLQEDPAFAEIGDDGDSIPLDKIGAWMDVHHGRDADMNGIEESNNTEEVEELEAISKKRSRGEGDIGEQENQQEDVDDQIALEIGKELKSEEPPNKRQKNHDDVDDYDQVMQSSGGRTPIILGRGGTPCLATTDDAWAPQPGETATSPGDPTESLLASLGVSGDPKPRKQASIPPVSKEKRRNSTPQAQNQASALSKPHFQGPNPQVSGSNAQTGGPQNGRPMPYGPQSNAQHGPPVIPYGNGTAPNIPYGNGSQPNASQGPPQGYQGYNQGPPQGYHQGYPQGPAQGPPQVPQGNSQYGPAMSAPYGNGPPNVQGAPQYGPPVNGPGGYPQGQQWGPQRNPSFGNAPPYASQQYPQYPQTPGYGNANYGQPTNQYQGAPAQYPQDPLQYNQARQPSYGSMPPMVGQYGPVAQTSPTQYGPPQYGPPQNVPYNTGQYPNPNQPQYPNGPVNGYGNGPPQEPPNNAPHNNIPPNPNMPPDSNSPPNQMQHVHMLNGNISNGNMPNGNMFDGNMSNGNAPPRQDSGYVSARGSYSNGSGPNGFNNQGMSQNQAVPNSQRTEEEPYSAPANQQSPQSRAQELGTKVKVEKPFKAEISVKAESLDSNASLASNETASPGTPLSPESAELLRKLEGKPKRAKPSKSTRASLPRKVKAPQPVVQEAYSRRW